MNGAKAILKALEMQGVEIIFGHPGGTIMPTYDALYDSPIRHVLVRHEQGGIHAATGYARASGRVGVVMATSGPGALNLVTGLQDALMDSTPVVAITGNVPQHLIGTDAFQEADVVGITQPVTKHNMQVRNVNDIPRAIAEAFYIASTGRPGPVLLDFPKDVQLAEFTGSFDVKIDLPGYKPTYKGHPRQIERALEALSRAERPVLMIGGGAQHASAEVTELALKTGLPVIPTLMGLGAFPGTHPQCLGMPGMHGSVAANRAIQYADTILAIGLRFDDRVTGKISRFAPNAHTVIHVDIDPAEIGKLVKTSIPVVGDAKWVAAELVKGAKRLNLSKWWAQLEEWKSKYPFAWKPKPYLQSQEVIQAFWEATGGRAIVTSGVGQHQMFVAQFFKFDRPRTWINSGGLGTMGVGLPFAIGAALARPDELVIDFDGDGSFQMTLQELATLKKLNLNVKIVILNNGFLGMVRQWQDLFHARRYSEVYLADSNPDFAKLAEAYGIPGFTLTDKAQLQEAVREVLTQPGPVLLEARVHHEEGVFPMIPSGGAAEDMIIENPREAVAGD
ncbi:MAG: biosynthetic-type acetolactate synthase large subunit [Meiothermus sp.]|uniref:biosynthetic-type acetolactate synthase large subunit n=1 Tax=Meiothermus sp. TaxID=1955249 RepID=UPI0025FF71D4|nr:biosynthetic-type acetolactate synthase large subunit [Meiothermus sp.]MCS7059112.1 biosynthetic-type acetolactate synthase large subunit [Meiothermus sp.]MCS7195516.1 biosynthetic-type acetolactate synthase large subunit [Meiothermus sp.]MCX7741585.1 biosynthetic-type acetolactate synthase large subunit [Meiothermus sp.]MDW8481055.1 biosynthetic-type acetolactate synthase large subunit [Meiothermus sp.]